MKVNPLLETRKKRPIARLSPTLALISLALMCACEQDQSNVIPIAAPAAISSSCNDNSALQTILYGVIETTISWAGSDMICENMRRPAGQGIRLRFAGEISGEQLALIIAMPELRAGLEGVETATNVTATVEGSGRFFTTPGLDSCWTDVRSQTPLPDDSGRVELHGELSCIAALGEVNGNASLSIPSMSFTTLVDWGEQ